MRSHRYLAPIVGAVLLALVAGACSSGGGGTGQGTGSPGTTQETGEAVRGGTLNMLGSGDVDYMDPNVSYYSIGYQALRMWSRQLFTNPGVADKATTSVPDLATEIPTADNGGVSADGKTYTIKIRPGAQWDTSPARQVSAADVVRGVKRTCNPVQPFGGLPDFQTLLVGFADFCKGFADVAADNVQAIADYINNTDLPGVVAKDETTVVFTLTHPASYFVDMLTLPAFSPAPEEVLQYLPASAELAQNTISDGPYKIETYTPTKQIVFVRNPAWNADTDEVRKAYVDKIVVNETVSQESTQQQLETGTPTADMEFDNFPPPSRLSALIAANDPNLNIGESFSTNPYLVFNTVSPNNANALQKVEVRQALSHAINRGDLVQSLGGPEVSPPLTQVLPPGIVGSEKNDPYPFDVNKAKQMLTAAGTPTLTLKVLYRNESEGSRKVFATVQQNLQDAGITVEGVTSSNADFYTKYLQVPSVAQRGVWDLAVAGWGPDWYGNSALSFFAPLFSGEPSFPPIGSNFGFYNNAKANDLIEQATTAETEDEAAALWAQADKQVMADAAFFPITTPQQPNYHAAQVHNTIYIPSIQNFDATNVWLESGKQGG